MTTVVLRATVCDRDTYTIQLKCSLPDADGNHEWRCWLNGRPSSLSDLGAVRPIMWYGLVVGAPGAVGGMSNFREVDRETGFLLPPSVNEWLPGQHLARFVVEVVESLDLRAMTGDYRGSGSASYHPAVLLGILVYGYA